MNRFAFQTLDLHRLLGTDAGDVTECDVRPIGEERILVVAIRCTDTGTLVGVAGRDEECGLQDILHDDVVAVDVFAPTATTRSRFETTTDVRTLETAVLDYDALHTAAELRTDDEATVCAIDRVVADEEIALRTGIHTFLSHTAFHTDTIITAGDIAVHDKRYLDITRVHGITVLRPVRTTDVNTVDDEVLNTGRHQVELRRIEQMHMLDKQVLGVGDVDQVRTHLLLNDGVRGDIRHVVLFLEVERVPYLPVLAVAVRFDHTAHSEQLFPLLFAHFLLLDRTPVDALSVQGAVAGDGYVLQFGAIDAGVTLLATVA